MLMLGGGCYYREQLIVHGRCISIFHWIVIVMRAEC